MITPAMPRTVSAAVPITLTALDPVHHGAGTSGNTALMRMQDAVDPSGEQIRVPYVSGASVRHAVRDALAWTLVEALGLDDHALSKPCVDLLWSGGALTATGAQTDLRAMSGRHVLLPQLALLGYSLGSDIVTGSLRASNVHLACAENHWRLPAQVRRLPAAGMRSVEWMGEAFGTRHDVAGTAVDRMVDEVMFGDATTTQMIFDTQVVRAGSVWHLVLEVEGAVPGEVDALAAALTRVTAGGTWWLAAKRAQGYGRCSVTAADTGALCPDLDAAADRHIDHIRGHADAITALLAAVR